MMPLTALKIGLGIDAFPCFGRIEALPAVDAASSEAYVAGGLRAAL